METYALFSDKSISKILFSFFKVSPKEKDRIQIKCRVRDAEVCASAEKGIFSALSMFENIKDIKHENYYVVCEFSDDQTNYSASGQSAGLAFCVKFIQELLKKIGQPLSYDVAATGELSDSTKEAFVTRVENIQEKINAVLPFLKQGDKIFYPAENKKDISSKLEKKIKSKKIELHPVATEREAIEILLHNKNDNNNNCKRRFYLLLKKLKRRIIYLIPLIIFVVYLIYQLFLKSTINCEAEALRLLEYGEFAKAENLINDCQEKEKVKSLDLLRLNNQLHTILQMDIKFIYLDSNRQLLQSSRFLQNLALNSSNGYRFEIQAFDNCFFYIFQFDNSSNVELLYPLSHFYLEDHLLARQQLFLIPGGNSYFYLKDHRNHGKVTLYFLASFWRAKDIEELCEKYNNAKSEKDKVKASDQLLQRIKHRLDALGQGINGIFYDSGYFFHQ